MSLFPTIVTIFSECEFLFCHGTCMEAHKSYLCHYALLNFLMNWKVTDFS